jgi:hypothetical protein
LNKSLELVGVGLMGLSGVKQVDLHYSETETLRRMIFQQKLGHELIERKKIWALGEKFCSNPSDLCMENDYSLRHPYIEASHGW